MSNNPSIDSLNNSDVATSELRVERVRHAFGARHMQLMSREIVSPGFMRLTLGGADLSDFNSAGFDDHVKLLLPLRIRFCRVLHVLHCRHQASCQLHHSRKLPRY